MDLAFELRKAIETGKVVIGSNETIRLARAGEAKLIIMAKNAPKEVKDDINYYASPVSYTHLTLPTICSV